MEGWLDGWMDRGREGWMGEWINGGKEGLMDIWMNEWMGVGGREA